VQLYHGKGEEVVIQSFEIQVDITVPNIKMFEDKIFGQISGSTNWRYHLQFAINEGHHQSTRQKYICTRNYHIPFIFLYSITNNIPAFTKRLMHFMKNAIYSNA